MLVFLIIVVLIEGVMIMAAIDNLTQAIADLKATIDNLIIPSGANDAAIQAAADSVNASILALKAKVS